MGAKSSAPLYVPLIQQDFQSLVIHTPTQALHQCFQDICSAPLSLEPAPAPRGVSSCPAVTLSTTPKGTKLSFPCSGRAHLPQTEVLALSQAILRLIQYLLACHPFQRLSWLFSTVTFSRLTPPMFNLCAAVHSMDWCNFFPILKGSTKKSNFPW